MNHISRNRIVLTDNQLQALNLRIMGLTYKNVGGVMECSEGSAVQYVKKAINNIRRAREQEARIVAWR